MHLKERGYDYVEEIHLVHEGVEGLKIMITYKNNRIS
jgi:hypothetical protein